MNNKHRQIPVAAPVLNGNEKKYVLDCLDTTWISSNGKYINKFEEKFAEYIDVNHAITCCNGTVALHLALLAIGINEGDEVIVPTLTYIATANAVTYCRAKPVFVDSEQDTWNINPNLIEDKISSKTKAIIVVHLYGHPVNIAPIIKIAKKYNLYVIEDAAEAHGAQYRNKMIGSIGDLATFSFYGNKIISTGEGGMVVTNDPGLEKKIRMLRGQGVDPDKRYWFPIIGYNYRMTNIAAAIGLAQLENVEWHIGRRKEVAKVYFKKLCNNEKLIFQKGKDWAKPVYWMVSVAVKSSEITRDEIMMLLEKKGIETRPVFYPMHILPPYKSSSNLNYPIADEIAKHGINLPTWAGLTENDVIYVCECINEVL
jgi:perosamine synthetase